MDSALTFRLFCCAKTKSVKYNSTLSFIKSIGSVKRYFLKNGFDSKQTEDRKLKTVNHTPSKSKGTNAENIGIITAKNDNRGLNFEDNVWKKISNLEKASIIAYIRKYYLRNGNYIKHKNEKETVSKSIELNILDEANLSWICQGSPLNDKNEEGSKTTTPPRSITVYEMRKFKHDLPESRYMPNFEPLYNVPTEVFRYTAGEVLGPNAHKCGCYLNPEYYSFHHMSFYDMHLLLCACRKPQIDSKRKP